MEIGNYSSKASRLESVCDHYLDLGQGLREASDRQVIWPCPSCGRGTFVATFEDGAVGCVEQLCKVSFSMGVLELVGYLDEGVGDQRGAAEKVGEILEAAVRQEQERQEERKESKQRAAEQRRWQRGLAKTRARKPGYSEERLF